MKKIAIFITLLLSFNLSFAKIHLLGDNLEQIIFQNKKEEEKSFVKAYPSDGLRMNYLRIYPFSGDLINLHFDVVPQLSKSKVKAIKEKKTKVSIEVTSGETTFVKKADFAQNNYYQEYSNYFGLFFVNYDSDLFRAVEGGDFSVKILLDEEVYAHGDFYTSKMSIDHYIY